jgi:HD superfamily phosphohydrolase
VYGFITIPYKTIFDLIEHPYFQRLRRIRQLGLTHLVYPGALHTRFHHALGALHLMCSAIETIRSNGHEITEEEAKAVCIAILLHDIGHAPFSHALEDSIVTGVKHEQLSVLFMDALNKEMNGELTLAIEIFKGTHHKKFLHQLVSSQLDMDRLDYLNRDSFYTGVEGNIESERIIKMLNVHNDELVIEEKGIYSIEKFIIARRLMYWQVYLHKTVISAEQLLVMILRRAKEKIADGEDLFAPDSFRKFLNHTYTLEDFLSKPQLLNEYSLLDDYDVHASIKMWTQSDDKVLAMLCNGMINRKLYKIRIQKESFPDSVLKNYRSKAMQQMKINEHDAKFLAFTGTISNSAYDPNEEQIKILSRDGRLQNLTEASDQFELAVLSRPVEKHYICVMPPVLG